MGLNSWKKLLEVYHINEINDGNANDNKQDLDTLNALHKIGNSDAEELENWCSSESDTLEMLFRRRNYKLYHKYQRRRNDLEDLLDEISSNLGPPYSDAMKPLEIALKWLEKQEEREYI